MRFLLLFLISLSLTTGWGLWMAWQHSGHFDRSEDALKQATAPVHLVSVSDTTLANRLSVFGDTNRDGVTSAADLAGHKTWSWSKGGLLLANVDDDDQDGVPDWQDQVVNGAKDAEDLTRISIYLPETLRRDGAQVYLEVGGIAQDFINVFQLLPDRQVFINLTTPAALDSSTNKLELAIEAKNFAHQDWDGFADIRIVVRDATGQSIASDQTRLRVTPWIMLPNSAQTTDVYVSAGVYDNELMRSQLHQQLQPLQVNLHEYLTDWWEEMWMQDTMEIGYQEIPGHPRMHVVMRANRDADRYPPTLLAPNMGYITVGTARHLEGDDQLADWFGNLQASHPVPGFPLGRIYYGRNEETGIELQPEVVNFLQMQQVQSPVWVDTSWLTIKHVDEIFNFVPGPKGQAYLMINSPALGIERVQTLNAIGMGNFYIGYPQLTVQQALDYVDINQQLQQRLDRILAKAQQDFNLPEERIIKLPLLYGSVREAYGLWSNPVNSIYINGTVIAGDPRTPQIEEQGFVQQLIQQQLDAVNISVQFVDDRSYQENRGNVHCATNAKKQPVVSDVWQNIPDELLYPSV